MTIGAYPEDQSASVVIAKPICLAASYHADEKTVGKSLKLLQHKLLDFALTKIDHTDISKPAVFGLEEFYLANGVDRVVHKHYQLVRDAMVLLPEKLFVERNVDANGKEEIISYSWVTRARISEADQTCEIRFNPDLQDFFSEHQKSIIYQFNKIALLSSKYAYRLYGLVKKILGDNEEQNCMMELKEFLAYMDAINIPNYKIRSNILDPAVTEINNSGLDISISYEMKKTGRSFTHLLLFVRKTEESAMQTCDLNLEYIPEEDSFLLEIKKQIDYDFLAQEYESDGNKTQLLNLILDVIAQVYSAGDEEKFLINRSKTPRKRVMEQYRKLDNIMVQSVIDKFLASTSEIKNVRSYIQTALYNEPMTLDAQATTKANADMSKHDTGFTGQREFSQEELNAIQQMMAGDILAPNL